MFVGWMCTRSSKELCPRKSGVLGAPRFFKFKKSIDKSMFRWSGLCTVGKGGVSLGKEMPSWR